MHNPTYASDVAACHGILRGGSKSFALAGRLLPTPLRDPAAVIYAFCRQADDAIDASCDPSLALVALEKRLDGVYGTEAIATTRSPVDRALTQVVQQWRLPRPLFDALLEGFAWDAQGRSYATYSALCGYAARVAASVGAIMTLLMGERRPAVLARACDLGIAMQLTNIARDVGEDARAGRLYLPRQWLSEAGVDATAFLDAPVFSHGLGQVVARLLAAAEPLYRRSEAGIHALPRGARIGIYAARFIYEDIGGRVAQHGFDSVSSRAVVPLWRKLWCAARGMAACCRRPSPVPAPTLQETEFLVQAATVKAA